MREKGPRLVDVRRLKTSLLEFPTVYNARAGHVRVSPLHSSHSFPSLERFSYDLEIKTREQNRNNKRTEIEQIIWFIERIQTRVAFGWLSERSGEKTFAHENFLEINRYFALTSYCNTIGQSNNTFSI